MPFVAVFFSTIWLSQVEPSPKWSQFRGDRQTGVETNGSLPTEWSQDSHIAWKAKIAGYGWSQPVVWGDRIFVTSAVSENQTKPSGDGGGRGRFPGGGFPGRRGLPGPPGNGEAPSNRGRGGGSIDANEISLAQQNQEEPPPERPGTPSSRRPGGVGEPGRGPGAGGFNRAPREAPDAIYQWEVACLDRKTGKELWREVAAEHKPTVPTHRTNSYASETPATDGEHVFAYFGMTGLYCYTTDGKLVWKHEVKTYPMMNGWGTGSSPVIVGDAVIIQCDNEEDSFIVAFEKSTGKERWRVNRNERSTWSTPFVWQNKFRTEIVTGGSNRVRSYDPATGKIWWELTGIAGRSASTAVGDDAMVYLGTGGGMGTGPLIAIKAGAQGEFAMPKEASESSFVAWVSPRGGPPMASPLLYDGLLYVLDQRGGILTAYDASTGEVVYKERLAGATGFTASPWAADGKIYCLDSDGTTFVLKAGRAFEVLRKNPLGEMAWSSPALADGTIYLRTVDHLYCIQ